MAFLSGFRAATATFIPSAAKSRAQLALIPGPPPTINATSELLSVSVSDIAIPLFSH
jgi:hypothetical protein